jgi:F-type H+-transporting ATPase subunit b
MFDEKFWLAISFFCFLAILYKFVYASLINSLNAKTKKIANDILDARKMRENAQRLLNEAQNFHKHSLEQSKKIINDAIIESKKIEEEYKKNLNEQIDKITKISLDRIKSEEEIAIREVKKNIIEQSILNIAKLNLSDLEHKKIFDKSIDKISKINL